MGQPRICAPKFCFESADSCLFAHDNGTISRSDRVRENQEVYAIANILVTEGHVFLDQFEQLTNAARKNGDKDSYRKACLEADHSLRDIISKIQHKLNEMLQTDVPTDFLLQTTADDLYALDLTLQLAELFVLQPDSVLANTDNSLVAVLVDWAHAYYCEPISDVIDLAQQIITNPNKFWHTLLRLTAEGRVDEILEVLVEAIPLLPDQVMVGVLANVQDLLSTMPLFGPKANGLNTAVTEWRVLCSEERHKLMYIGRQEVQYVGRMLSLMAGDHTDPHVHDLVASLEWPHNLVASLLFVHPPSLPRERIIDIAGDHVFPQQQDDNPLVALLAHTMYGDFDKALSCAKSLFPSNAWLLAHVSDFYMRCAPLVSASFASTLQTRDELVYEYACSLVGREGVSMSWLVAVHYLASCSHESIASVARATMAEILLRQPPTTDETVAQIQHEISYCRVNEILPDLWTGASLHRLRQGAISHFFDWAAKLCSHDPNGLNASILRHVIAESASLVRCTQDSSLYVPNRARMLDILSDKAEAEYFVCVPQLRVVSKFIQLFNTMQSISSMIDDSPELKREAALLVCLLFEETDAWPCDLRPELFRFASILIQVQRGLFTHIQTMELMTLCEISCTQEQWHSSYNVFSSPEEAFSEFRGAALINLSLTPICLSELSQSRSGLEL